MTDHTTTTSPDTPTEQELLVAQLKQVAEALGATFAPFCEVVLHDLSHPEHAILAIHNNLSMRKVGAPATELGLARIADPAYPQVIANYPNQFDDGRQVKSTSIGIKDSHGTYVAALCLNIDLTMFRMLGEFTNVHPDIRVEETLQSATAARIRQRIDEFVARLGTTPRSLQIEDRRALIHDLKEGGYLEVRRAPEIIAAYLGVSRATIYADAK